MKLIPVPTRGGGDCAFHAIFGKPNGRQYVCDEVKALREKVAQIMHNNLLLPSGLEAIACAHKITVNLVTPDKPGGEKYNPSQQQVVNVYFNGKDHYEAMKLESSNTLKGEGTYEARGLKDTLHGNIYQLKLLMLFLQRGYKQRYEFRLATEMEEAQKFDDLVFQYKKPGDIEYTYLCIQVKHKRDEDKGDKVISAAHLLTKTEGDFSLQKYFISYQRIKKQKTKNSSAFKEGRLGEFCIYTNIGFDFDEVKKNTTTLKLKEALELQGADDILRTTSNAVKYKFRRDEQGKFNFSGKDELDKVLRQSSDLLKLAKTLNKYVTEGKIFQRGVVQENYEWLIKEGIIEDAEKATKRKLTENFKKGTNLSPEAEFFRELYIQGEEAVDELVTDEDIEDFLHHLVFAVNQPNEVKLGEIIEGELGREFNLINSKFIYAELQKATLDWMKEKAGTFLTADSMEPFLMGMRQQIHQFALIGPTLAYQRKLEEFGITFTPSEEIKDFLGGANQVMIYHADNIQLGSIQAYQTLAALEYKENDSYVFIHLKTALRLKEILRSVFAGEKGKLLVLSCDELKKSEAQELVKRLVENLSTQKNKQIIFITADSQSLTKLINNSAIKPEITSATTGFESLTENSQKKLRDYQVNFQGQETSLITLAKNLESLINIEVLAELIEVDNITVGRALKPVNAIYLKRRFSQSVHIREACLQENRGDIFVIEGEIDKEGLQHIVGQAGTVKLFEECEVEDQRPSRYMIVDPSNDVLNQFQQIVNQSGIAGVFRKEEADKDHPSRYFILDPNDAVTGWFHQQIVGLQPVCSVHLLKREQDKFIWQQSYGSLKNLRPYIESTHVNMPQSGYTIISAEPGMGKSTDLSFLAQKLRIDRPTLWVMQINLLEVEDRLKKTEFTNVESIMGFFMQGETALARKIFEYRFNTSGDIALFFDGFDEIQAKQQEKVILLLQILKKTPIKNVVIATRPHMQEKLENALCLFSYKLKQFEEKDRYEFFARFWQKALDLTFINREKVDAYATKLIKIFAYSTRDRKDKFIGIPLQAEMLAIAFLEDFKKYYVEDIPPVFPERLPLYALYQRFIKAKYRLLLKDKFVLGDYNQLATIKPLLIKSLNEQHRYLAFNMLFPKFKAIKDVLSTINEALINTAGIAQFVKGKPYFIHRTFAEYFAAEFLIEGLNYPFTHSTHTHHKTILIQHIFKARNHLIREFIEELVNSSDNVLLGQIWEKICHSNLLPNVKHKFIFYKRDQNFVIPSFNSETPTSWNEARRELERYDLKSLNRDEKEKLTDVVENFCKAVLSTADIEKLAQSLVFLSGVIKNTNSFNIQDKIKYYLADIFLHYIKTCSGKEKLFNNELIQAFKITFSKEGSKHKEESSYPESDLFRSIDILHGFIVKKPKITPDFINLWTDGKVLTEGKIFFLSLMKNLEINKALLTVLKSLYHTFKHNSYYRELLIKSTTNFCDDIRNFLLEEDAHDLLHLLYLKFPHTKLTDAEINTIFSRSESWRWLKTQGISLVNNFKVLTPKVSTIFSSCLPDRNYNYNCDDGIYNYDSKYAGDVWKSLLLPLLHEIDFKIKNGINKTALLSMCKNFMQFLYKNDKNFSFGLTSSSIKKLLKLVELTLNEIALNKKMLSNGITQLYLLNKMGLHIVNTGNSFLILDPNSEFEYELQLTHKDPIQELLLFKADIANSQQAFEDKCKKTLESILFGQTEQAVFQERKLLKNNPVQQSSATLPREIKRTRSLESFSLGDATENRFLTAEPINKRVKRAPQPIRPTQLSDNRQDNSTSSSQGVKRLSPEGPAEEEIIQETRPEENQEYKRMKREETTSPSHP
jgi:hypothetical protein